MGVGGWLQIFGVLFIIFKVIYLIINWIVDLGNTLCVFPSLSHTPEISEDHRDALASWWWEDYQAASERGVPGSMSWGDIVVRSLPGDTPENIERMIAQATNGDATAEILHINRVAVWE